MSQGGLWGCIFGVFLSVALWMGVDLVYQSHTLQRISTNWIHVRAPVKAFTALATTTNNILPTD